MNAYELADGLDKIWDNECRSPIVSKSADMLRQQQVEIDALKKYIAESNALDKKLHESIKKANEAWGNATKSILKKAKDE
jgi:flagellar motility protein MotE (MotC chaperone)